MKRENTCMFTGHRDIDVNALSQLSKSLDVLLEELIVKRGYTDFCAGGARGFDTIAALKVLEKKEKYGFVKLHLCLPCKQQERGWSHSMKQVYYNVLDRADSIDYACDRYISGCMQLRNRKMVDKSSICIAYCKKRSGGTYYTIKYAQDSNVEVIEM